MVDIGDEVPSLYKPISTAWGLAKIAYRADPYHAVCSFVGTFGLSTMGGLLALWVKLMLDSLLDGDRSRALVWAVTLGGHVLLTVAMTWGVFGHRIILQERSREAIELEIARMAATTPGIEHLERPAYLDALARLRQDRVQLGKVLIIAVTVLGHLVELGMIVLLLGRVHPLLLGLPLIGIPPLVASRRAQRVIDAANARSVERERLEEYLFALSTSPDAGKEIRVFGLGAELRERHWVVGSELNSTKNVADGKAFAFTSIGGALHALGYVIAVAILTNAALTGAATVGDVVLAVILTTRITGQIDGLAGMIRYFSWMGDALRRFAWFADLSAERGQPQRQAEFDAVEEAVVALQDVRFTYPGTDRAVISGVTLELEPGTSTALVGDNGAGKTTLVKLILGLYEPDMGTITVGAQPLCDVEHTKWRQHVTAAFQDFAKLEFTLQESVGVGDLASLSDAAAVRTALERASAGDLEALLPGGLDARLGASFVNGVDLSGGQWQKVALARSMMRRAPLLVVLDEPTASLDARSEHELFKRYAEAAASTSGITLFVTHRFSTVRDADRIVVMKEGRIAEVGSHRDLVAAAGIYAEMYHAQAAGYADAVAVDAASD